MIRRVRAAADISKVIGGRIGLRSPTSNVHVGKCPFHADAEDDLWVNAHDPKRFRCVGCWAAGDAIDFVQRFDNLSYAQALLRVGTGCNVDVSEPLGDADARPRFGLGMPALHITRAGAFVDAIVCPWYVLKLGRLASSHIVLDDPEVGRMHAVIETVADGFRVIDLGFTGNTCAGGTYLNGEKLLTREVFEVGDTLRIGDHELEFVGLIAPETEAVEREAAHASARMCLALAEQALQEQRSADARAALEAASRHVRDPAFEPIVPLREPTGTIRGLERWLAPNDRAQLARIARALADDDQPLEPTMESELLLAPHDDAPRLVFADWLQQRGDPRGEFIALQIADARGTLDDRGRMRLDALLQAHREQWSAEFTSLGATIEFRRGFPSRVSHPGLWSLALIGLVRRWTTIERAEGSRLPDVLAHLK
jgi:uncharacterized protein (TIGR02996 family)